MPDEGKEKNVVEKDMPERSIPAPDYYKIYESIRISMEREDTLINHRIEWAISLSSSIFVTEGILAWGIEFGFHNPPTTYWIPAGALALMTVLSGLASYFCWQSRKGVEAAYSQIDYLRDKQYQPHANLFQETLKLPRPFAEERQREQGRKAAHVVTTVMPGMWLGFTALQFVGALGYFFRWTGILPCLSRLFLNQ